MDYFPATYWKLVWKRTSTGRVIIEYYLPGYYKRAWDGKPFYF